MPIWIKLAESRRQRVRYRRKLWRSPFMSLLAAHAFEPLFVLDSRSLTSIVTQ